MKLLKIFATAIFISIITGCASGAKVENMISTKSADERYDDGLKEQVLVQDVSGGKKTNPAWTSEISNESFKNALTESLKERDLYSENGRYVLSVVLVEVAQPLFGFNTTCLLYTI